jgi:fatty acid-binding protein DegV
MRGRVAVVTDSSACLDLAGLDSASPDLTSPDLTVIVVPLRVLAGGVVADDATGPLPAGIARELSRGERLSTARPAPDRFAATYAAAVAAGATAIVSVHLSRELSGTIGSAELAAAVAGVPVHIVDSRSIGAGLGIVVRAAALAAAAGQAAEQVAQAADRRAARLGSFFALDSQDQLRAGGRLSPPGPPGPLSPLSPPGPPDASPGGPGAAGSLLRSRPLLHISDGRIVVLERVRTRSAVRDRLTELATGFAAGQRAELAVQHLDNPGGAARLRDQLTAAIPAAGPVTVVEAGTAIRAHAGPGLLGVVVAPVPH